MSNSLKNLLLLGAVFVSACATTGSPSNSRVDFDSHLLLAEIARDRQNFEEAAEHYLAASLIAEDAGLAELTTELAQQLNLLDIGFQAAERWQELRPEDPRVHMYLGTFLLRSGDEEGALAEFEAFVEGAADTGAMSTDSSGARTGPSQLPPILAATSDGCGKGASVLVVWSWLIGLWGRRRTSSGSVDSQVAGPFRGLPPR